MKIGVASDQGAYIQKDEIVKHLQERGFDAINYGTDSPDSIDYTDIAKPVADDVSNGKLDCGILMCGTGIGVSLAANKVRGVRAAVVPNLDFAHLAKEHNNANIICLSGRFSTLEENISYVDEYLNTKFAGDDPDYDGSERHIRRVGKIMQIEKENFEK